MRIGLLTYHWVANYGANLQMYSTYCYLKNNGYNPIIINWIPESGKKYYQRVAGTTQLECHRNFLHKNCELTRKFCDIEEFLSILHEYKITHIIIGSDSVFNIMKDSFDWLHFKKVKHTVDHIFPNPFWCNNIDIPHIALSVSSQNASYKKFCKEKTEIGNALTKFRQITVRDEWTKNMVAYFTDGKINPTVTPDPVFAFNTNVKQNVLRDDILNKYNLPEKYVLFTFNEGRMKAPAKWIKAITLLFHSKGYACVYLPRSTGSQKLHLDNEIKMPIDPIDWYNLIRFSNGYIGVLMHPIVVCLHNAVPFYSFDHYGNGPLLFSKRKSSKIYDIISKANILENHYFLRNHLSFPSPNYVFERILHFPSNNINGFANFQERECLKNMDDLVKILFES